MSQLLHHHHNTYTNLRNMHPQGHDIEYPVFSMTSEMYTDDLHYDMDPNFVPYNNFPQRTVHEQAHAAAAEFGTAHLYHDAPGYPQRSPSLNPHPHPHYAGSPELHNAPFNSSLSSASGQSASSSNVGSPYSSHAAIAPPVTPWPSHGLGIQQPSIAGDDFGYQYSFGGSSGMEQQDFNYTDVQKPIGFVGECANVSVSWSSSQPLMPTSNSSMGSLVAQRNAINSVTTSAMQQIGNQVVRPLPMSPPSVRQVTHTPFSLISNSSRASHGDIGFSPRSLGTSPLSAGDQRRGSSAPNSASSSAPPFKFPQHLASPFFSQSSGHFLPPFTCPDPSILQPYGVAPVPSVVQQDFLHSIYPPPQSPAPSDMSSERSSKRIKSSQSPYAETQSTFPYAYAASGRISMSPSSPGSSSSLAKNQCPFPDCGKAFKDLKAHMLTHQLERPEKCPISTCDYHVKGFARKYDKNRHTLTHYKGTMVCGFCPGSGSSAEKSFNRADVFKRHLTSVHYVEQVPPNARRKSSNGSSSSATATVKGAGIAAEPSGKCSTCSCMFKNAQDFYEHLDDCVLRLVQQEEPSEAINAQRLAEVENDKYVHDTLRSNNLPITTSKRTSFSDDDEEEPQEQDDANDGDYSNGRKPKKSRTSKKNGVTPTKAGRKKRKEYPTSWGCPQEQMKMKKRTLCVYDGQRRMWKEDMMMSSDYEVRVPIGTIEPRTGAQAFVTDLDVLTMQRAEDEKSWHQ